MKEYRLRKCIPLKVAAHIFMTLSFVALMVCFVFFLKYLDLIDGEIFTSRDERADSSGYFISGTFRSEYGRQLDSLYHGLNLVERDMSYGYPLSYYLQSSDNFKYAIFDTAGELIYASGDWAFSGPELDNDIFYYAVDLNDLHLFNTESIRRYSYTRVAEMAEVQMLTDMPEIEIDADNVMKSDDPVGSVVEYSSNFTTYTSFYSFNETLLADRVGYIFTYVPENLVAGDSFYDDYMDYTEWLKWGSWSAVGGSMAFLVIVICLVYLLFSAGYSHDQNGIQLLLFDKLHTEISAALILLALGLTIWGFSQIWWRTANYFFWLIFEGLVLYAISIFGLLSFARRVKMRTLVKNALIYKMCNGAYEIVYNGFINNHIIRKYIAVIFGFGIMDFILMFTVFISRRLIWGLCVVAVYVYEFIYVGMKLLNIQKIKEGAQKISAGDLQYKIDTSEMSGVFREFAEDINNIGNGLNVAVDESIKSERMKAALITNVSHDIKTPLTSIINYVDLLKRENITQEPIKEYIDVLDMKSQRLKALTEDLVEASRASSGNITLDLQHIDLVELAAQAAGTYQEKFESKDLVTVMNRRDPVIMIMADGRRLYRVLDNLFSNAFKYAMPNTRIYVDMFVQGTKAYFIMKNISSAPLNISPEELTQRFVRGDTARTTEGSGLGLSIAQSLTELHGGQFAIDLDGDLFKVSLTFEIAG